MKIAVNARFLLPDKLEGIGKFTHEILKRITVQHPEHQFYFLFDRAYDKRFIYSGNVKPLVLYPSARHPFLDYIWFQIRIAQFLKQNKPDVFLSTDGMTTIKTSVPRVTVMHDIAFEHYPQDIQYIALKYYRHFSPLFARASDKIIAVSEYTKQDLANHYHINSDNIEVVYNDAGASFKPISFEQQVGTRQQYAQGEAYFIFVGALQPRKNLVSLFRAFDIFKKRTGSEVKLLVVGRKAWKAGSITEAYEKMAFKNDVLFTGRVTETELVKLYGSAIATVYVPTFEGFGIPIVEAQNCHCPVITSNTSSMPEVAGTSAILVDPFVVEDIAAALAQVYHQLDIRANLIESGKQNIKRFSWDQSAAKMMNIMEEVVAGNKISLVN